MIMEWKKVGTEHQATWRGDLYVLHLDGPTQRWHLMVGDQKVKQHWSTPSKAMREIDLKQQQVILGATAQLVERGVRLAAKSQPSSTGGLCGNVAAA